MENEIFGGLDSFLKNRNNDNGVTDQRELKNNTVENEESEVQEKKPKEEVKIGLTIEELEAELKNSGKTNAESESDNEESDNAETKEETQSETQTSTEESSEESEDIWKSLSTLFKEKGIVEEDFDSQEKMVEVFGKEVEKGVNGWIDNLPDEVKTIVEAAAEGLNGQSLLSFIESKDNELQLEGIEDSKIESDLELAKSIVRNHLKTTTKYSTEKIEKRITQLEDLEELIDEAKEAKTQLVEIAKERQEEIKKQNKLEQEAEVKRNAEIVNKVKQVVDNTKEIIPGIKLTEKDQKELHKMITTPVELRGNNPISAAESLREKDPIKFEMMLNYFIKEGFFEGKFDNILKKAETKVVSKIEKDIEASAKKLLAKTTSTIRKEENPDKKNTKDEVFAAWKNRKI